MRNWVALRAAAVKTATIGSTAALLLTPVTFGASSAVAAPASSDPVQVATSSLPPELVKAISRDLKIDPTEYLARAAKAQQLSSYAQKFRTERPKQFAGAWIAADGRPTVGVTSADAAKIVAADGYQTKLAPISADGLDQTVDQLTKWISALPQNIGSQIGGIGIDVLNNQIVLNVANSPVGQMLNLPTLIARIKVVLSPNSGGNVVKRPMGGDTYISTTRALGGAHEVITICSFGFNSVDAKGNALSISAGHCDPNIGRPNKDAPVYVPDVRNIIASPLAGNFAKASLGNPANGLDYSLIKLSDRAVRAGMDQPRVRGANGTTLTLTGTADPVIGAPVCKSGQSSAFSCGVVTADRVETQLMTEDGTSKTIRGFATSACTLSGDSGGPIVTGSLALGITSGSNSSSAPDCTQANVGLAFNGGTASLGIPIRQILADANATSGGGVGAGLRVRTAQRAN